MFRLGWRGQRVWKVKAKGGGWDPWSLSPVVPRRISPSPKAVTLRSLDQRHGTGTNVYST